ncbi:MAG: hypothetical protein AAFR17_11805 [Pseudomonadota bacterium]
MAQTSFGVTTLNFPRATGLVARALNALIGPGRSFGRDLRGLNPAEREDLGLSLADMRRIGA